MNHSRKDLHDGKVKIDSSVDRATILLVMAPSVMRVLDFSMVPVALPYIRRFFDVQTDQGTFPREELRSVVFGVIDDRSDLLSQSPILLIEGPGIRDIV